MVRTRTTLGAGLIDAIVDTRSTDEPTVPTLFGNWYDVKLFRVHYSYFILE